LALHRIEQLDRVVLAALEQRDPSTLGERGVGGEPPRPVHEGTRRHQGEGARGFEERSAHAVDPPVDRVVTDATVDEPGKDIVLAPHDALGHACRAAGVDHDEVVAAATPGCRRARRGRGRCLLVRRGPVGTRPGVVVDPEPAAHPGHPAANLLDPLGERTVEDDGYRIRVGPQVTELVVSVAVVGVDRYQSDFHGGVARLQILGGVVEVDGHLVLLHHAQVQKVAGDPVRAPVELTPARLTGTLDNGGCIGLDICHGLPHIPVVPIRHCRSPSVKARPWHRGHRGRVLARAH
jgi:hypothetical protein